MKRSLATILLLVVGPTTALAAPRNYYEWSAVAPVVVSAISLGLDGRYVEARVERVFRGEVEPGTELLIDIREANRKRNRNVTPHAMRLDTGIAYLLLLEPGDRYRNGVRSYRIVRGVRGARELPAEGDELILAALQRFVEIQDLKSDRQIWHALSGMLEETNPLLVETALLQFLKFQQGERELLLTLRPLLDHPTATIRENTARLIGMIVTRHGAKGLPEEAALRSELIGVARRDPAVPVRVSAAEALGPFPGPASEEVLELIAENDSDQAVRYAASKILLERRRAAGSPFD